MVGTGVVLAAATGSPYTPVLAATDVTADDGADAVVEWHPDRELNRELNRELKMAPIGLVNHQFACLAWVPRNRPRRPGWHSRTCYSLPIPAGGFASRTFHGEEARMDSSAGGRVRPISRKRSAAEGNTS
ncbi:hypothetical protein BN1232_02797 [Mycobacterium lentiflavum]|uniref:Uncharacterized protein n=1 Tax=Mycobacterium lentiflavum TaxID=141349 RepID=A0A0E4GYG3_MYCLN|nr:hypothetical protein [Mycobacterium lentiflavum]CQD13786.1 hypothetical protein BN1232_02797 [Mycobacterium lentiflavum]